MYICPSQSPNSSHHHFHPPRHFPPLVSIRFFSTSVSQFLPCKPVHLDVTLDHLAEVGFVSFLHYKVPLYPSPSIYTFWKDDTMHSPHLRSGGTSLVAQWLRICQPMQGTRIRALAQEDATCGGATKSMCHNYWACALEPMSHNY